MNKIKKYILGLFSSSELEHEVLSRFHDDFHVDTLTKDEINVVVSDISNIQNIEDYLLTILKNDRIRYFNTPKESQDLIRGAFLRTMWQLKEIRKSESSAKSSEKVEYNNPYYG